MSATGRYRRAKIRLTGRYSPDYLPEKKRSAQARHAQAWQQFRQQQESQPRTEEQELLSWEEEHQAQQDRVLEWQTSVQQSKEAWPRPSCQLKIVGIWAPENRIPGTTLPDRPTLPEHSWKDQILSHQRGVFKHVLHELSMVYDQDGFITAIWDEYAKRFVFSKELGIKCCGLYDWNTEAWICQETPYSRLVRRWLSRKNDKDLRRVRRMMARRGPLLADVDRGQGQI
jgi:hypothetical protein